MKNFKELLNDVKIMVFDVDGVLSTASIPLYPNGEPMRVINTKDGYALHHAARCGYPLVIITGGATEAIRVRFEGLGFSDVYMSVSKKIEQLRLVLEKYNIDAKNVLYMGDDIPDMQCMRSVGIPVCPADAAPEVKKISVYVSDKMGGNGCVRDVVEQVLKAQGNWLNDDEAFGW